MVRALFFGSSSLTGTVTTTKADIDAVAAIPGRGAANPSTLGIFICALPGCNRLFQFRDTLMRHRKRDHGEEDGSNMITWNGS
ncbi:hypothetical protein FA13DRAFT_1785215 [Coprinellus micaceus]|uniref:C2H2-type domain-containing protein n=1 Tax=Coprinellus micaceus TaxID=71717 RepID=A0A4Y7TY59_COPMI|nr:hypothetical protein FA13DRAFT_1785215 [Coprinellus micaceus]